MAFAAVRLIAESCPGTSISLRSAPAGSPITGGSHQSTVGIPLATNDGGIELSGAGRPWTGAHWPSELWLWAFAAGGFTRGPRKGALAGTGPRMPVSSAPEPIEPLGPTVEGPSVEAAPVTSTKRAGLFRARDKGSRSPRQQVGRGGRPYSGSGRGSRRNSGPGNSRAPWPRHVLAP